MLASLQHEVSDLLDKFSDELRRAIQDKLYGIYVYGSCAYNAFNRLRSDVDIVVVVVSRLTDEDLIGINRVHQRLTQIFPLAKRMDGQYVQLSDLGKRHVDMKPYPWFREGVFHASGYADINSVTWWTLKHNGITIYGPDIRDLNIAITWNDVLNTMDYNLNTYWLNRAKRPHTLVKDIDFSDAVLSICRIAHTMNHGEIVSKRDSGELALNTFPLQWKPLINEAIAIRNIDTRSHLVHKVYRSYLAMKFIRWAVAGQLN